VGFTCESAHDVAGGCRLARSPDKAALRFGAPRVCREGELDNCSSFTRAGLSWPPSYQM